MGPIRPGMVSHVIAETNSFFGTARTSTRRPTGVIIDPPMPCRKRAITNSGRLDDMEQATEPSTKTRSAMRKMFFAPNLSAIQPLIGMKTPSATR